MLLFADTLILGRTLNWTTFVRHIYVLIVWLFLAFTGHVGRMKELIKEDSEVRLCANYCIFC